MHNGIFPPLILPRCDSNKVHMCCFGWKEQSSYSDLCVEHCTWGRRGGGREETGKEGEEREGGQEKAYEDKMKHESYFIKSSTAKIRDCP